MGLMECPAGHGLLITTPHVVTCDGQKIVPEQLIPGESLAAFLRRTVPNWAGDAWEVRINGVQVPVEVMERVRPKDQTIIEVRGVAKKQALYIVAMIALTYFTFGLGTYAGIAGTAFGGGIAGAVAAAAVFAAGSILINKVLGPKRAESRQQEQQTVYNIGASRNQVRQYQPLPLVFGRVKYAPDILSAAYTWYEGDDQILGMVLTPGINAHSFEPMTNGDAPLSAFQGVQVYQAGFPGMPEQEIPLYGDADTIQGGELNKNQTWVQRTTPPRTVRIQNNLEYILGDQTNKGKPNLNVETVESHYRPVGTTNWIPLVSRNFTNSSYDPKRATMSRDVPEGQYDVRLRILGRAIDGGGSNGRSQWNWMTMTAVQADTATYAGIPRIGIRIKATGQLNNAPDELRCVVHSRPIPVWKGTGWVTEETSNPGAQILQYARGINDENGDRIAGIGLEEDMIDVAALQAFMLHCAANGFEYNYVIKDARNHDEMVNALAMAGFGQVTWASGRLSVVWAADEQPLSGVVNMATIKKGEFQVDYTLANPADGIEYSYYDAEDWSTKTIRIPAPGVTTMLNPATVTGEGVTSEAHAALLGRWHLAQSLYQYKDISFATDIEHLSYRRLSLLSLSHDLTQWGFSGRLRGASIVGGVVSLALDEPVRAPPAGSAYIGLRIPGERTYRVFGVQPFEGETKTLTLTGTWPNDAALPGAGAGNPAHDTLWCYDFKATPGYRVRVVAIEPENDLKGARVAVVPESAEFWNYVNTGQYIPAPNESLLQTRPIASNLVISERQVVQGDTVFTELVATYDITGPVGDVVVQMSNENGELEEVARTTTRTAAWRIPRAGTYQIVVRPFSPEGQSGIAVATIYSTIGADAPPVLIDLFDVQERSGGVRLYTWGWFGGTTQSADFAGVEIRYIAGSVPIPDWNAMTPVGNADGYHTAPFEAVIPDSGQWTFAARSRNTSGTLSTGMRVQTKTLGANLGEQIGGIGGSIDWLTQEQIAQQALIDQARADAAQAQAAAAEALALAGTPYNDTTTWPTGAVVYEAGRMYRALQISLGVQPPNPAYWQDIGTITEAQGATTQAISQLRTDVDDQGEEFAAAITQVRAGQSGEGNLLSDPNFDLGISNWAIGNNGLGVQPPVRNFPTLDYAPKNTNMLLMYRPGASTPNQIGEYYSEIIPIGPALVGERLFASGYTTADRATTTVGLAFYNSSNQRFDEFHSPPVSSPLTALPAVIEQYDRQFVDPVIPAGASYARFLFRTIGGPAATDPVGRLVRPMVEVGRPGQPSPSMWTGSEAKLATATLALQAAQDAQITLTTNVNGHVTGMVSKNDGQRGVVSFLADVFEIIASGTVGVGFGRTGRGGYCMRFYAASMQLILGINFGTSDNLMAWYGPNVGEANCTKANGTAWADNAGNAYLRGSIIAGSIRNGGYSTSTNPNVTYNTGQFGTLGTPIQVNASYAFEQVQLSNAFTSQITAGSGATGATIQLWRALANGALQLISAQNLVGSTSIINESDGPSTIRFNVQGSITFMDNDGGTQNRTYEIRMINRTLQNFTITGGSINTINTSQSTGVITAEN
ncbi:host specificity factor TipJ family phage tail protein [Luteimonas fraxinea]|uniref:Tail protein n=1 Tax=Luteimonas fraxinea TaxID=2901869 RepID=A0ABS8U9P8_9GAMM|nr:host specificity factor TipJ family phage tail protein [Luteimonas fraxinea]MCD9096210.1 hypothetical protein [Luteimonas fraxinea]